MRSSSVSIIDFSWDRTDPVELENRVQVSEPECQTISSDGDDDNPVAEPSLKETGYTKVKASSSGDQHSAYSLEQRIAAKRRKLPTNLQDEEGHEARQLVDPVARDVEDPLSPDPKFEADIEEIRKQVRAKRKRRSAKHPLRLEQNATSSVKGEDRTKNTGSKGKATAVDKSKEANPKASAASAKGKKSKSADLNDYIMQLFQSQKVAKDDRLSLGMFNKGKAANNSKKSGGSVSHLHHCHCGLSWER